jgi:hypothetical protein
MLISFGVSPTFVLSRERERKQNLRFGEALREAKP